MTENIFDSVCNKIQEMTDGSAIAYLPSGFVPVAQAFRKLAKEKKQWNVDVIDDESDYTMDIEKRVSVKIPKVHIARFKQDSGLNIVGMKNIDLSGFLQESFGEAIGRLTQRVSDSFYALLTQPPCDILDNEVYAWSEQFWGNPELVKESVINISTIEADVEALLEKITLTYQDDRGNLDMLARAFEDKRPLGTFKIFRSYDYLEAAVIRSIYRKVEMVYECTVDLNFKLVEKIFIYDEDVLEHLMSFKGIKISGKVVYPIGEKFQDKFFLAIKTIIDEL